jgi:hypothetical protein
MCSVAKKGNVPKIKGNPPLRSISNGFITLKMFGNFENIISRLME